MLSRRRARVRTCGVNLGQRSAATTAATSPVRAATNRATAAIRAITTGPPTGSSTGPATGPPKPSQFRPRQRQPRRVKRAVDLQHRARRRRELARGHRAEHRGRVDCQVQRQGEERLQTRLLALEGQRQHQARSRCTRRQR